MSVHITFGQWRNMLKVSCMVIANLELRLEMKSLSDPLNVLPIKSVILNPSCTLSLPGEPTLGIHLPGAPPQTVYSKAHLRLFLLHFNMPMIRTTDLDPNSTNRIIFPKQPHNQVALKLIKLRSILTHRWQWF